MEAYARSRASRNSSTRITVEYPDHTDTTENYSNFAVGCNLGCGVESEYFLCRLGVIYLYWRRGTRSQHGDVLEDSFWQWGLWNFLPYVIKYRKYYAVVPTGNQWQRISRREYLKRHRSTLV